MERFPSGQREQTVNLLSVTSVVRIHPSPPRKSTSQDVLFSWYKRVDFGCFLKNSRTLCVPNHLSVLTLVLLNKFSTALLNESTPLHHENPCCLARIFFYKTILCLSAVFSWFYRAENLCYQFIHGQKLLPQFRRLSACYPNGNVLFLFIDKCFQCEY